MKSPSLLPLLFEAKVKYTPCKVDERGTLQAFT